MNEDSLGKFGVFQVGDDVHVAPINLPGDQTTHTLREDCYCIPEVSRVQGGTGNLVTHNRIGEH